MKHFAKILALLLTLAMLLGMLPTVAFAAGSTEDVWDLINDYEATHLKRSRKAATADDYAAMAGDIAELVMESDDYKEGTCTYDAESGNSFFFWESADGEPNGYSPRLRARIHQTAVADAEPEDYAGIETVSYATRGGSPKSTNVAVFQPYYGIDSSFTTQYKTEGESIAQATGGTCTTYLTTNATITQIGAALSNCGVVIFDSHGDTDYYVSGSEDYVTRANTSYLCLQSSSGWTSADKAQATGDYNTYYHAYNAGSNGSMHYYCFDGTAMANHMTANATPNNLVWMAICLGMATTGLHAPLRSHGVGVVYGYSQSVTFNGDYAYEEDFWTKMKAGENVATAFNYMTSQNDKWDSYSSYNTIGKARYNYAAFPNVVSAEDNYQGHRSENPSNSNETSLTYTAKYGACNVQTVNSTWTLFAQHEITASSNNTNYGTVSISGSTITASPKTGYTYASPAYTVTPSGAATVTQSGNTFTVSATADCNVRINFAAKQKATITYIANSNDITANVGSSTQYYTGDTITLPSTDTGSNAAQGYTFLGWVTQTCDGLTQAPQYAGKGTQVQLTSANSTFYALYSKTEGGTGTSDVTDVIAAADLTATSTSYTNFSNVSKTSDARYAGNSAKDSSGNIQLRSKNSNSGIVTTTSGGKVKSVKITVGSGSNTVEVYGKNTAYSSASDLYSNTTQGTKIGSLSATGTITVSGDYDYVGIRSSNGALYLSSVEITWTVEGGGTTTYTTNPAPHVHDAQLVSAVAPTCGEEGHSAYYYCAGCGKYFSDSAAANEITRESTAIAPTGNHSYGAWTQDGTAGHTHTCSVCGNSETVAHTNNDVVTAPTATTMGYTTHTCTTCNYEYVDTYTAALGSDFTVSFSVPSGVTQPASMVSNTNTGITLPTPVGTPDGEADGYTFLGWVDSTVDNDTSKPEYLEAEENYIAEQNVTLKALYSYVVSDESGSTEQVWKRMEAVSELSAGIQLVFASDGKGRTAGDISSTYMSEVTSIFDIDNGTITSLGNDTVVMTLGGSDGAWTFSYEDALLGTSAAKSLGWGSGTTTWTISISGSNATIASTDDTCGRLLHNVNANRFTTYTSSTNTSMLLPQIYYLTGSAGTTYYTTEITPPCAHTGITWTSNGNGTHSGTCPSTCGKTITEACSYNAQNVCTVCGYHRPTYTVTFSVPGGVTAVNAQTCLAGESITLPTAQAPEGYTFLGWVTTDYDNVDTQPGTILTGSYTATANVTLKALYTYTEGNAATNEYALVTSLSNANKVILYNPDSGVAVSNAQSSAASYPERYRAGVSVTPENSKITTTNTAIVWTVEIDTNGIAFKDADGHYLSTPSSYSNLVLDSDCKYWTVTEDNGLFFVISTASAGSSGDLRGIEYYQEKFTTHYANNTNLTNSRNAFGMELYVQLTGTPYWTTVIAAACEHPNESNAWTYDDTYHWHVCPDCTVHVSEAAHTYDNGVVTAPTENAQGYTTYTCTVCGQSYVGNYVPALGTDYTVSFTVPTGVAAVASMTCNSNGSITLPTAQAPEGYTFVGWVTTDYDNVDTQPGTILTGSYTATGNVTLKALYTYTQGGGEQTVDTWTAVDVSTLTASDVAAIVFTAGGSTYAMSNNNGSSSAPVPVSVTVANGAITGEVAENVKWNIAYSNGTFTVAPNGDETNKLYCTNTNNGVRVGKETNNTFSIDSESGYIKNTGVNRYLGVYGTQDIRCYTSATADNIKNQSVAFYKLTSTPSGTPYWTTVIAAAHEHTFGEWTSNNDGTHSRTCSECNAVETVDCTYNASGLCTVCGYQLPTYTVSFSVPSGVTAVSAQSCLANGSITLPTANAPEGYTFEGWVAQQIDPEDDEEPAILTGPYTPEASVTLYAVYSRVEEGSGVGSTYNKISSASDITNGGSYVIVSSSTGYAMSTTVDSNWVRIGSTYSGDSITNPTEADVWTINNGVLSCSNGSLYSYAVKKVELSSSNSTTWTFEASGGTFTISDDGNELAYNTSGGWRPYNTEQTDNGFYIYKAGAGSTTYYTTNPTSAAPAHSSTFLEGQAATCEVPGVQDYYYCTDCLNDSNGEHYGKMYSDAEMTTEILDATIPALGHNFTVHPATNDEDHYLAPTCTDAGIEYLQCSRCEEWDEDGQLIAALGHSLTATPANSATCTTAGNSAYWTCSTCGKYFSDAAGTTEIQANSWVIAATGHTSSYVDNRDGTHDEVCSVCGTVLTDNEAHVYDSGVCIGCGAAEPVEEALELVSAAPVLNDKIDMVYAAKVPDGYTNPYVVFSFNGVNTTVTEHTTDVNGNLNFVFTDVNPQCMGDNISATLYATKAGTEESVSVTNYSVRQYCVNMLARTGDNAISNDLRTLLSNLLAYGAAAQTYMGYKTNALVNENTGLTNAQLTPSTFSAVSGKDASFEGEASTDVYWLSAGLTLTNSVAMNFSFYAASTDGLTVQLQVGSGDPVEMTYAAVTGKDNVYAFSFTGIDADHFDDVVTVRFYNGNEPVGNALSYRVNSYVQAKQNDAETANLAALVRALYLYGASAAAYSTPASNG